MQTSSRRRGFLAPLLLLAALPAAAATVVVNDATDTLHATPTGCATTGTGTCSLRDALTFANANTGSAIHFSITGAGVHTLQPATPLPGISAKVTIDGFTQPGSSANTNGPGLADNSVHLIEIDGTHSGAGILTAAFAFGTGSNDSIIRGLVINRCPTTAIQIAYSTSSGYLVEGNFLGTDPTGAILRANGQFDILIDIGASNVTIGGTPPASRNVISGAAAGIGFGNDANNGGSGHVVQGNFIGTNAAGTGALPNGVGISMHGGVIGATIGGNTAAARNIISGNSAGISIGAGLGDTTTTGNFVQGNYVGTTVTGSALLGNGGVGIALYGLANTIGGGGSGEGNVVSGNQGSGIEIIGGTNSKVQGNLIGTDATGTLAFGNHLYGVYVGASMVSVGGTLPGERNVIAFNGGGNSSKPAVAVVNSTQSPIRGNSIHDNSGPGIDLADDGITANDDGDADTGANNRQNFPVITSVAASSVQGTLRSTPDTTFTLELFASPTCSATGFGEGKTLLGTKSVTTNASGVAPFSASVSVPAGQVVTATATDPLENTSEFSQCAYLFAAALALDPSPGANSDGDGVLEPGEAVLVAPAWRNPTAAQATSITGTASGFTGPAGATYSLDDMAASYGSINGNAIGNCTAAADCYAMFVSNPATRPAVHWDTTFQETLHVPPLPDSAKSWKLHVGASFQDVPRSQLFYRKIETIFHHGITVGCTPTEYCPSDKVPRSQMAIFIARGIQRGAALPTTGTAVGKPYNCVAGGTSAFTDVSPGAIFCKGVHFIAAKNVTGGCSTGHYCPDPNVTRSEMAIFMAKGVFAPAGGAAVPVTYGPDPVTGRSYSCDAGSPNLHFSDILTSDSYCKHVHYLWATGVIAGCSDATYCPSQEVGRDEMAKFLGNAFQLELYGP